MSLVISDFAKNNSISGIWEINNDEESLLQQCRLTKYDRELLKTIKSKSRRLEILSVRALLNKLIPDIEITYKDKKPICNKGYIAISHSKKYASIIWHLHKKPSIDIEEVNNRIHKIKRRAFSETELQYSKDQTKQLTIMWSAKECIYKLINIPEIDFKNQIEINNIIDDKINCTLKHKNLKENFVLNKEIYDNHIIVWTLNPKLGKR